MSHIQWQKGFIICPNVTKRFHYMSVCDTITRLYLWAWLIYTWRDSCIRVIWISLNTDVSFSENDRKVTWRFHICDMTHLYVWHDVSLCLTFSSVRVTWLIYVWRDSSAGVTWLICVWRDLFIYVTWLIYTWHDLFIHMTWLIYMWHDWFTCVTRLIDT